MSTDVDIAEKVPELLERVAAGESVRSICASGGGMPSRPMLYKWLAEDEEFARHYAAAVQARADHLFEEMLEIADGPPKMMREEVKRGGEVVTVYRIDGAYEQQRKTQIDTRKFMVARLAPKKYGERTMQELSGPDGAPLPTATAMVQIILPHNGREEAPADARFDPLGASGCAPLPLLAAPSDEEGPGGVTDSA